MDHIKYICFEGESDKNVALITFPKSIDHDAMAEAVNRMRKQTTGDWSRQRMKVVGAGFVTRGGACYGRSATLGIDSRDIDTEILKNQY